MFNFDLKDSKQQNIWLRGKNGTVRIVNETMNRNDILFTRYAYCNKGGLFNQQIVGAPEDKSKAAGLIPIKKGMNPEKYGGYTSVTPSHFMLVESKDKKGNLIRTIETVPLYKVKDFNENEGLLLDYCREVYGLIEPRIILPCIKKNARIVVNGFPMHLKGSTGKQLKLQGAVQLCLDNKHASYLKKITKYIDENAKRTDKRSMMKIDSYRKITKEENMELYNIFIDKLSNSIYKNRPVNICEKIFEKTDKFISLEIEEQCFILSELLHLFQCRPVSANLTLIGESKNAGVIVINKKITNFDSVKMVSQSPTGVFQQVVDLLTV
jgi:CRISPR-associated endonuclease Csn1